jgi:membrane glycosyltransferase
MADVGGVRQFLASLTLEILLSIAYAPLLMIQQTIAVVRSVLGIRESWKPQARGAGVYGFWTLVKFHAPETVIGMLLLVGMALGLVTLWLIPIAISLALAVPLSALSGVRLDTRRWSSRQLGTPEQLNAPQIIRHALAERRRFADVLAQTDTIAAE